MIARGRGEGVRGLNVAKCASEGLTIERWSNVAASAEDGFEDEV